MLSASEDQLPGRSLPEVHPSEMRALPKPDRQVVAYRPPGPVRAQAQRPSLPSPFQPGGAPR